MGLSGKYILDIFLSLMQYGFVVALSFFTIINLKEVVDGVFERDVPEYYLGKSYTCSFAVQGYFFFS
jgi:hypothetical protein